MRERHVTVEQLADEIVNSYSGRRLIVGLAGAPGSGKSTLAEELSVALNGRVPLSSAVLSMDGYHYDDAVLARLGRLTRKGAPDTFDVGGLAQMLKRLSVNDEETVAVPIFDRAIETSRAAGCLIPRSVGIIIAEGNYLLLKRSPWDQLDGLFDRTVMVHVSTETLRRRLEERWRYFNLPEAEVQRKVETNDLPNGAIVITESRVADFVFDDKSG